MTDLYIAGAIITLLSALLFLLGRKVGKTASPRLFNLIAVATVALLWLYVKEFQETWLLSRMLPFSSVILLGAWHPLFGGFLSGMTWQRFVETRWRKYVCVLPLVAISAYAPVRNLWGDVPWTKNYWVNGVCLQTSASSCSAAAAATMLAHYGINATETELSKLCLTRSGKGTTWFGLYRGLKLKTAGTDWDVEIVKWSPTQLINKPPGPVILSVRLDDRPGIDPRYQLQWGWTPGLQHAVVLFECMIDGRIDMGDPSVGREIWTVPVLDDLWHGDAMRLVTRK